MKEKTYLRTLLFYLYNDLGLDKSEIASILNIELEELEELF